MRMAKASEQDIEAAMELMVVLNNVDSGYYPAQDDGEDAPTFFEPDDREHLAFFFARVKSCLDAAPGFVGRVVCGMHTIMHNDILDPNEDCLALHPKFAKVAEQRDKLLAVLESLVNEPQDITTPAYQNALAALAATE